MPFTRPAQASNYMPQLPPTGFYSHLSPFQKVMQPIAAFRPNMPNMPRMMQPGMYSAQSRSNAPMAPQGPEMDSGANSPPQQIRGFGFGGFGRFGAEGPGPGSTVVASLAPSMPQPQAQARGQGPRSPYASGNAFPARTMRQGQLPQFRSTAAGIRAGVVDSGAMINQLMPQAFSANNRSIANAWNGNKAY